MRARIRGVELYFDVDGMGLVPDGGRMVERPVLFLLHGGPGGDHVSFKRDVAALRDAAQLVFIDHRGSGRSGPCDPESQTLEENIHDVDALRDYLGLERVSILGSSYGGVVAQGYAINYPDHVFKLILSCTAPSFGFMDDAKRIVAERGSAEHERVCKRLWDGTFESEEQLHEYYRIMGPMYSTTFDLDKFEATWSQSIRNFDQLNRGFGDFLRSFDYTDQLHMIRCPTLVLAGAHDWICPPDQSQLIAEKIPRAQLKIFANSAHSIAADETDAYVDTVRGFLAREGA